MTTRRRTAYRRSILELLKAEHGYRRPWSSSLIAGRDPTSSTAVSPATSSATKLTRTGGGATWGVRRCRSLPTITPRHCSSCIVPYVVIPFGRRVYVSLDHHWSIRFPASNDHEAFAGKDLIDYLSRRGKEDDESNFDWHVAYHPYPENLFEPRFWNDKSALLEPTTPRITFKNLEVLTDYLRRPELLYEGRPRRVILSEQGFHTPDGPMGEAIQAAAYCYAYRKVARLDGVDAFILHRHVDHPHEGGLRLGLRRFVPGESNPRPT